jgi:hypothetical protein
MFETFLVAIYSSSTSIEGSTSESLKHTVKSSPTSTAPEPNTNSNVTLPSYYHLMRAYTIIKYHIMLTQTCDYRRAEDHSRIRHRLS